jgi:hypothetical protein
MPGIALSEGALRSQFLRGVREGIIAHALIDRTSTGQGMARSACVTRLTWNRIGSRATPAKLSFDGTPGYGDGGAALNMERLMADKGCSDFRLR